MSFRDCLNKAESDGDITPEQAIMARDLFDRLDTEYQHTMGSGAASARAASETFKALKYAAFQKRRHMLLQMATWKRINYQLKTYRDRNGNNNIGKAAEALFDYDGMATFSNVAARRAAIEASATSKMTEILAKFRRNLVGENRSKAELPDLVREIFEEGSTGNASAREMAKAWSETAEYLRLRFNVAGGRIPKRADWGMPQHHNIVAVRSASYDEWKAFTRPRLDVSKMIDERTGLPIDSARLEFLMREVYESISQEGWNKITPSGMEFHKAVGGRHADHRFLAFRDAETWMEYQTEFGNPNYFDTMMGHINTMARDIAMAEILGPHPHATVTYITQVIQKDAKGQGNNSVKKVLDLYAAVRGLTNVPIDGAVANTMGGVRQLLQSAQLGSAAISAISDLGFQRITRQYAGLPNTGFMKIISQYIDMLNPLTAEERGKTAVRMGLIAEGWTTMASAQMRYVGDISGPEITRRIADFTMRASLLSPFTQAGRWAFGMEFLGTLAENASKPLAKMDAPIRNTLRRHGINEREWAQIRRTPLYEYEGAQFLRAEDIEARTDMTPARARALATMVLEMVVTETNFAVPSTSVRGRTALIGDTQPGTLVGELTRSFAMYKNFAVTILNTHLLRGLTVKGNAGKTRYLANLIITSTVLGALALQLREISKGRDPRPMDTTAFWAASMMQGGGLGIFGDFMFDNADRYGRGLPSTVAGPVVGFADDVRNLTTGNLMALVKGDDPKVLEDMVTFMNRYVPGGSVWYSRLALERMIFDQLRLLVNPDADKAFRQEASRRKNQQQQEYWWGRGELRPERAPELSNALGGD